MCIALELMEIRKLHTKHATTTIQNVPFILVVAQNENQFKSSFDKISTMPALHTLLIVLCLSLIHIMSDNYRDFEIQLLENNQLVLENSCYFL